MLIQLRKIPGTATDHLMKLRGKTTVRFAGHRRVPGTQGIDANKVFVVLSLDATGRLARLEFYTSAKMERKTGQYDYSEFQEAVKGAWIPCLHRGTFNIGGTECKETVRVYSLAVNTPIPAGLFIAEPFFKGVAFESSFEKIYGEPEGEAQKGAGGSESPARGEPTGKKEWK